MVYTPFPIYFNTLFHVLCVSLTTFVVSVSPFPCLVPVFLGPPFLVYCLRRLISAFNMRQTHCSHAAAKGRKTKAEKQKKQGKSEQKREKSSREGVDPGPGAKSWSRSSGQAN